MENDSECVNSTGFLDDLEWDESCLCMRHSGYTRLMFYKELVHEECETGTL